jgi:hypothetical protein
LRPYGFVTEKAPGEIVANFTDLNFLSDDLVLATVNNRVFGPVERADSDEPPSKLLLFEISEKRLLKSLDIPVQKHSDSIKAVQDGRFAMLNESGLRLCHHFPRMAHCLYLRPERELLSAGTVRPNNGY